MDVRLKHQAIIDKYLSEVAAVRQHNDQTLAEFKNKFQQPFVAWRVIVPHIGFMWAVSREMWITGDGSTVGLIDEKLSVINFGFRYEWAVPISTPIVIDPTSNSYDFPMIDIYSAGQRLSISPAVHDTAQKFLEENIKGVPDIPPVPEDVNYRDWRAAFEAQEEIPS